MDNELKLLLCKQIEAVNRLIDGIGGPTVGTSNGTPGSPDISALSQKISFDANGEATLETNEYRQGFIVVNKTSDLVYGIADQEQATADNFTWQIASEASEYYIPSNGTYTGEVNFKAVGAGYLMVTEFSFQI
ncbi:hypothetical protein LX73_2336 [Fodinibius salinus]|uniref:Uncharacterized protein n=1 Tax=Fodinibius salinus TaxID=860790 RepID=A0A5D3YHT5_9BACT|nr:hypothetical protein [Fodinibius salinus]TYP92089.1 hypothetical protein LX73_2336 [Fodinibius salinus]